MRKAVLVLVSLSALAGCAHQATVVVYDGGDPGVAIGERHGDQFWFYNGHISAISADNHLRLPDFDDAYLVGDRLYLSAPAANNDKYAFAGSAAWLPPGKR